MDRYALHDGAAAAFRLIDASNEFIAEAEPWTLARDPASAARLDRVLYDVAEALRIAGVLLLPIVPASAAEILRRAGDTQPPARQRLSDAGWRTDGERQVLRQDPMWPRLDAQKAPDAAGERSTMQKPDTAAQTNIQTNKAEATAPASAPSAIPSTTHDESGLSTKSASLGAPVAAAGAEAPRISIDDFMKVDLRTAKIIEAERVPKSRKLIKMRVDTGTEQRTLVAGIADAYEPETLVGRTVVIAANLQPATLMGIESNGMVLAASPDGGKPVLVGFDADVPPGTRIR
jgi:methionyl-tRNA synthetase